MEMVNGYQCRDCTDVAYAKKNIDPAHPKAGPFGVNAQDDPSLANSPAVRFGGALQNLTAIPATGVKSAAESQASGKVVSLTI